MVPLVAVIVIAAWSIIFGYFLCVIVGKRKSRSNVFDAYSDKELAKERLITASRVRWRLANRRELATAYIAHLKTIDLEIERRKNKVLMLEDSKSNQHQRNLNEFESVYGMILKDVEIKEKK